MAARCGSRLTRFVLLDDARSAVTVALMVAATVGLRLWLQVRADRALRALRTLATSTVTVRRRATSASDPVEREIPPDDLVPGDIVVLSPGDLIVADLRVRTAHDLRVD